MSKTIGDRYFAFVGLNAMSEAGSICDDCKPKLCETCEKKLSGDPQQNACRSVRDRHIAALNRAHQLRQFEIDLYWRRATYFWAFQAVALGMSSFAIQGLVNGMSFRWLSVSSLVGGIFALVAVVTAQGSKFWQENWEAHVDMLSRSVEGNLMQVVISPKGVKYSVSRVNERLHLLFLAGWSSVFIYSLLCSPMQKWLANYAEFFLIGGAIFAPALILFRTESGLDGTMHNVHSKSGTERSAKVVKWPFLECRTAIATRYGILSFLAKPRPAIIIRRAFDEANE